MKSLLITFIMFFGLFTTSYAEEVVYFSDAEDTMMPSPAIGRGVENPGSVLDYYSTVYAFDVLQEQYRKETGTTPSNPLAFGNYIREGRDRNDTETNDTQVIVQNVPERNEEIIEYNEDSALAYNQEGEIVRYGSANNVYTASVFSSGAVNSGTLFLFFLVLLIFIIVLRFTYRKRKMQRARMYAHLDPFHDQARYHPRA